MTGAGEKSWRLFRDTYAGHIELSEDQQWVRKRALAELWLYPGPREVEGEAEG